MGVRDDDAIRAQLLYRLEAVGLGDARIRVGVDRGRVRLEGEVRSARERERAAEVAAAIEGVTGVRNDLRVVETTDGSRA